MKPHRLMLTVALLCVVKFFITPTTDASVWLLPAALGAFLIGCVMGSFADDREHGGTATRDGLILFGGWIMITKFTAIVAILIAIALVVMR